MPDVAKNTMEFKDELFANKQYGAHKCINLDKIYGATTLAFDPNQVAADAKREIRKLFDSLEITLTAAHQKMNRLALDNLDISVALKEKIGKESSNPINPDLLAERLPSLLAWLRGAPPSQKELQSPKWKGWMLLLPACEKEICERIFNIDKLNSPELSKKGESLLAEIQVPLLDYQKRINKLCSDEGIKIESVGLYNTPHTKKDFLEEFDQKVDEAIKNFRSDRYEESFYAYQGDLKWNYETKAQLLEEETKHNTLYLRTLSRMLAEKGYDVSAEQLFSISHKNESERHLFSSQPVIYLSEFKSDLGYSLDNLGPRESTTPFEFHFGVQRKRVIDDGTIVRGPIFNFDSKPVEILKSHNVSKEAVAEWFDDFMKMALLAEHDYLHHLISPARDTRKIYFTDDHPWIEKALPAGAVKHKHYTISHAEDHALSLQAQIVARMMDESPERKRLIVSYAAKSFEHLAKMQQDALKACCDDETEKHKVNEAITYFAEVYSHRLFRVFSPEHIDSSISAAMNKLILLDPEIHQTLKREAGLKTLTRACAVSLGDAYKRIHESGLFPIAFTAQSVLDSERQHVSPAVKGMKYVGATEYLKHVNEDAAALSLDPEKFTADAKRHADKVRAGAKFRKEKKYAEALKIDQELRKENRGIA